MFNSGYIESEYDPKDLVLDNYFAESADIPMSYDFAKFQKITAKDQGYTSQCVPYSLSIALESRQQLNGNDNFKLDIKDIYNARIEKKEGMSIKEALEYMKTSGFRDVKTKERDVILTYGKLTSQQAIKMSIFMNGPCIMALPVYDTTSNSFWRGSRLEGGHAIACVGYNEDGFILLNSWGAQWGDYGKCILPYSDINKILECWTIIEK